ncbi:class I glutamine amidotransferase-like protein [Crepidotus variabilis]|uniref:Class I glutamine amidotransferase-like protein n=1 Tax=Crepidotus variabilis TaxID=179855 RepID=A0A9P6EJW0_9AGAR|nr:class I glutamine amidotransferase-like protein [Crepidotus variabilis]
MHFLHDIALAIALYATLINAGPAKILIFSATAGFRHDMIPTAIGVLKEKGPSINVDFDSTEDASMFTDDNLKKYDALLFLATTGDVLPNDKSFQRYLNAGGNFIGVHSASDALRNSKTYANEIGSLFYNHPILQTFVVDVLESTHPSVAGLPSPWPVQDEPYNFVSDPRSLGAKVVLVADESTYVDNNKSTTQGTPHPLAWYQEKGAGVQSGGVAGRSFYTSLGHLNESWNDKLFQKHILGAITWTLQSNTTKVSNASASVGNGSPLSPSTTAKGPVQSNAPSSGSKLESTLTSMLLIIFFTFISTSAYS